MAKKFYAPWMVSNQSVSEEVTKWYAPWLTGNQWLSAKVVKAYCAQLVNNQWVSKLFWELGATAVKNFWFYFKCKAEYCFTINSRTFSKKNAGIAFCYVTNRDNQNPRDHYWSEPRFASTDIDAIAYTTSIGGNFTTPLYSYQINGDTWYFNAPDYAMAGMYTPSPSEALLSTDTYVIPVYTPSQSNPRQDDMDLLDRVYCDDFAENYQNNNYYNTKLGNVKKTFKKGFAVFLYKHIKNQYHSNKITLYNALINNLDSIITRLLARIGNDNLVAIQIAFGNPDCVQVFHASYPSGGYGEQLHLTNKYTLEGYNYFLFETINIAKLYFTKVEKIRIDSSGNISYSTATASSSDYAHSIGLDYYDGGFGSLFLSNVGLKFDESEHSWNDYEGQRLVYDYDYQAGNSYSVNKVDIIDTFIYAVNKTIQWDGDTGYDTLYNLVKSKMAEMIDYIQNLLISTDNVVKVYSYFSNYNNLYIMLYIGHSDVSSINVTSVTCGQTFKWVNWDSTNFGNSRIFIRFTLNSSGTFEKTNSSYSTGLSMWLGNYHEVYSQTHNYLQYVINLGVHFEDFNTGDIVADWNFRSSNYDSVEGIVGCKYVQYNSSTIDSTGLHLSAGDYCDIPSWLMRYGNTLEIEFGDYTPTTQGALQFTWFNKNSVLFSFDPTSGVGWKLFDSNLVGTREETIGNTNVNLFKNSTFKMRYKEDGYIEIYKNNTKLYTSHIVKMSSLAKTGNKACIGQVGEFNIKTMKVYNS